MAGQMLITIITPVSTEGEINKWLDKSPKGSILTAEKTEGNFERVDLNSAFQIAFTAMCRKMKI